MSEEDSTPVATLVPRARTQEETEDWLFELPGRLEALSQEADLVIVRTGLVKELGQLVVMALTHKRTYTNKDGDSLEYHAPDHSAAARYMALLAPVMLKDPEEIFETSAKIRKLLEKTVKGTT